MRQFDVIVCQKMVTVQELFAPLSSYHVRANVDGDKWLYRIKKIAHQKLDRGWRERGYVQAYYHAKNTGSNVKFSRVDKPGSSYKRKRHPEQMQLL